MGIPKRNIRSLTDIRTLSGSVDQAAIPYRAYMKISCLEMEKLRRGKERESAVHRMKNIDTRFQEIEAEKAALLQALGEHGVARDLPTPHANGKSVRGAKVSGFRLKY
jgi:hypothetical protein